MRARQQGEIQCEHPNASLYTFVGNLLLRPPLVGAAVTLPLSPASVLLRGSVLRNTRTALGVVIFAGHETKARCPGCGGPWSAGRVRGLEKKSHGMKRCAA